MVRVGQTRLKARVRVSGTVVCERVAQVGGLCGVLVRRFLQKCAGLGLDPDDVLGIAQLALVKAAHSYHTDEDCSFPSYAWLKVGWALENCLRGGATSPRPMLVRTEIVALDALPPEEQDALTRVVEVDPDALMLMGQVLRALTDEEQQVLRLRFWQDETRDAVAHVMGLSKHRVTRLELDALDALNLYLDGRDAARDGIAFISEFPCRPAIVRKR